MNSNILELDRVVKTYQKTVAVDEVTFNIPKGSIFGLLGPNGAGKTSLIRIITTITRADSGQILLDGEKLSSKHPAQIGYMPEERGLYKKMKVGEQLMYLAQLKGLSKAEARSEIDYWFNKFEIEDWWGKKVEELSKGMQQKIQFISTVIHKPKLLILDEPFSGLDPINTNLIKEEITRLHEKGITVIFSTHRMEQVEEICERIVLINKGRNVLEGNVKEIKTQFKENLYKIKYEGDYQLDINSPHQVISQSEGELIIKLDPGVESNKLLDSFIKSGVHVYSFAEILPTLNEIFIKKVEEESDE